MSSGHCLTPLVTRRADPISPIHVRKTGGAIGLNEVSAHGRVPFHHQAHNERHTLPLSSTQNEEDKGSSIDSETATKVLSITIS